MGDSLRLGIVLLGFGTVFVGLVCLIFITKLMSVICRLLKNKGEKQPAHAVAPASLSAPAASSADRQALVAVVSAAIAEVMGTSVKGLRIHSIKKVD